MTCSPAGRLPLGFIFILSDAWGEKKSPKLFMTDDADVEINELHTVWPDAMLLSYAWLVLNAVWRCLWRGNHKMKQKTGHTY